eukprot:Rhum_TRINITY_DN13653_c2_g1::Rhum_TRINITY_DN13653_c2_g1_i1::g.63034::m.63034
MKTLFILLAVSASTTASSSHLAALNLYARRQFYLRQAMIQQTDNCHSHPSMVECAQSPSGCFWSGGTCFKAEKCNCDKECVNCAPKCATYVADFGDCADNRECCGAGFVCAAMGDGIVVKKHECRP